MGETIRYLSYLRVLDLTYKLIGLCIPSVRQFGHKHRLEDPSDNFFLFFRLIVKTLEQIWLEVSLDPILYIFVAHVS